MTGKLLSAFIWLTNATLAGILIAHGLVVGGILSLDFLASASAPYEAQAYQQQIEDYLDEILLEYGQSAKAKSYIVGDLDTGEILAGNNVDTVTPIASVSKLMTALVSLEELDQKEVVRITQGDVNTAASAGGLVAGERFTRAELLYPMMLESSNDAAEAIARSYGRSKFIELMNKRSESIGLEYTRFKDPSGISSSNVSTAGELFDMIAYLYHNVPELLELTLVIEKTLERDSSHRWHAWKNSNRFIVKGTQYYRGGKTGWTPAAGQTIVSTFQVPIPAGGVRNLGFVMLDAPNKYDDIATAVTAIAGRPVD